MLAWTLNMICCVAMLIYGPIIVQKQSYGPATLTITGNVISSKTKVLVVT